MKFAAHGAVFGSKFIGEFHADSVEEALRLAEADAVASFCHQCSRECENPEVEVVTLTSGGVTVWEDGDRAEADGIEEANRAAREDAIEHLAEAMRLIFRLHPELNTDAATGDAVELRRRIREASGCVEALR